jgi:hypothetical protein
MRIFHEGSLPKRIAVHVVAYLSAAAMLVGGLSFALLKASGALLPPRVAAPSAKPAAKKEKEPARPGSKDAKDAKPPKDTKETKDAKTGAKTAPKEPTKPAVADPPPPAEPTEERVERPRIDRSSLSRGRPLAIERDRPERAAPGVDRGAERE